MVSGGEHEAADDDGHGEANEVSGEAGDESVADFFDTHGAEVNGENIEGGLGGAEHDGGGHFEEFGGVGPGEDLGEDAEGAGAAEGAHEGHGEEIDGKADGAEKGCEAVLKEEESAGVAEDGEGGEHGHEEGHDAGGDGEALFGAIDELLINFDAAGEGDAEREDEEEGNGEGGSGVEGGAEACGGGGGFGGGGFCCGRLGLGVGAALLSGLDDTGDAGLFEDGLAEGGGGEFEDGDAGEGGEEQGEKEFAARGEAGGGVGCGFRGGAGCFDRIGLDAEAGEALEGLGHDDGGEGGAGGGEDGGKDDLVGVFDTGGGEVVDGGHGDQGEGGGIEGQEGDHGVAGGLLVGIELLEVVHGLESEGRGAVAKAEHVGGEVHDHGAEGGVPGGDFGKEAAHEGVQKAGDGGEEAGFFHEAHGAEPEHHHAGKGEGDAHDGGFGHVEGGGDDTVFAGEVAEESGDEDSAEDDGGPDVVQHGREIKRGGGRRQPGVRGRRGAVCGGGRRTEAAGEWRGWRCRGNQPEHGGVSFDHSFFSMLMVPIQIASQRSGVTAHVIRIWERRYQALAPTRTGTNRRMYSEEDVRRLRLLGELTAKGHRIGSVADLDTEALEKLLQGERSRGERSFPVDATPELSTMQDYVTACLAAARAFEGERLRRLLQRARLQFGQRGMLRQVVTPLINEIGVAWQDGHLRSGQEHLGTAVIREVLMTPVPGSQTATNAPEIVVATPSGEIHELGALLVAASARDLGWRVTYLGPNLPAEEISSCARVRRARIVAISVVYPEHCPTVLAQIRELRKLLPEEILLAVGGRAAQGYRPELDAREGRIEWLTDLPSLDRLLVTAERAAD